MSNVRMTNVSSEWKPVAGAAGINLAVGASAVAASALHKETRYVMGTVESAGIVVTFDGTDQSGTNGHTLAAGAVLNWSRETWTSARFVRSSGSDARLAVSQFTI